MKLGVVMADNEAREKVLYDLIRTYKLSRNKDVLEFLIACLVYVSKIKPNLTESNPLNLMEMLCMILLAIGKNPARCADFLGVSENSVKTYEQRMRKKLGAKNRLHAFYIAQRKGLLSVVL